MKTKIIGTSSYEDVAIGESYIQECVISMWDNAPQNAFVYFSSNGCKMVLKKYTKTAERTYTSRVLAPSEIKKKGQKIAVRIISQFGEESTKVLQL